MNAMNLAMERLQQLFVEVIGPSLISFVEWLQKGALNADCDGQAGLQQLAGDATMLFYMTEEAQEGRDAFKEKRKPDFNKFKRLP